MRLNFAVRKLCVMGILAALSVVLLLLIRFPIFPSAAFLEFDAGDVAILTGAFLFGPVAGVALTFVASLIQSLTVSAASQFWGFLMHFISTSFFCVIAVFLYHRRSKLINAAIGLAIGVVLTTALMVPLNLLITPLYTGAPTSAVASMLVPTIIPFNLIKFSLNALFSFLLWRSVRLVLKKLWGESDVA